MRALSLVIEFLPKVAHIIPFLEGKDYIKTYELDRIGMKLNNKRFYTPTSGSRWELSPQEMERLTERGVSTRRGQHTRYAVHRAVCSLSSVNLSGASPHLEAPYSMTSHGSARYL